jgi:hypothetical protein
LESSVSGSVGRRFFIGAAQLLCQRGQQATGPGLVQLKGGDHGMLNQPLAERSVSFRRSGEPAGQKYILHERAFFQICPHVWTGTSPLVTDRGRSRALKQAIVRRDPDVCQIQRPAEKGFPAPSEELRDPFHRGASAPDPGENQAIQPLLEGHRVRRRYRLPRCYLLGKLDQPTRNQM